LADNIPLHFQGNHKLEERELYSAINLNKPYFYEFYKDAPAINEKVLPLALQTLSNYYKSKGFYHTEITVEHNKENINFIIKENAAVYISEIKISSELPIASELPFKEGDIFDANKFTQSKKNIALYYAKKSFCNAKLSAKAFVDIEKNSAKILYKVIPKDICLFRNITVSSSKTIDKEIIKSLLYIRESRPFSIEDISKSYKNIYAYPGVSTALINTNIVDSSQVDVNVSITENEKPIRFKSSLGYSSDQGVMAALGVEDRNFFGNLKSLGISTTYTEIYQNVKINYAMPLVNRDTFGAEVGVKNEDYIGFKELSTTGTLFLEQRDMPHSFKESLIFDNIYTYGSDDLALFANGGLFILSPKFGWGYDVRDNILDPTKGYYINTEITGSVRSAISDASYAKFLLSGAYILPLIPSHYLASKVSAGTLRLYDGSIPPSYRFYAGGTYSNRAYSYRGLGPKDSHSNPVGFDSIAEVTLEYRFPVYGNLRGVIFSDNSAIGNSYVPDYNNIYNSGGIGVRYTTPIGPISFDVGFDLANPTKQYAFNFHIGELF
jgi:translocation and assembly module TamA